MKIAVFASGSGSNFQAIAEAAQEGRINAEIALLICDKPEAFAVERAEQLGIPVFTFRPKDYSGKAAFEQEIVQKLQEANAELIVLAGYMRLIGQTLLTAYENKIINIHPSLLPSFPGKDAIGQAWEARVKITGVTVHYVDAGMDTGPIISQEAVAIKSTDSLESVTHAVQAVEHRLYPETIQSLIEKLEGSSIDNDYQTSVN